MGVAMLRCEVLTLFPRMVSAYVSESVLGKAQAKGLLEVKVTDIRDFAEGRHRVCDDAPYGGGAGMVMKPEPLVAAIESARTRLPRGRDLVMSPRGTPFTQSTARELSELEDGIILVCGRYEGVDERVLKFVDAELSIGDFVLTGGEVAAMAVLDSVARLRPGVLGNEASASSETFEQGLLEHPHYTRPPVFRGDAVPAILQSGDHSRIARWRRWQALKLTRERRPDLFAKLQPSDEDPGLPGKPEEDP